MASFLVCLGRFAFFIVMGLQFASLASYPATYESNDGYYALLLLYLLPLGLWLFIMCKDDNLQWLFFVWFLYTIAFVIFIAIIFGGNDPLENKLNKKHFFGPNVLKMTLCLSPVLLLLLLSTGTDSPSYRELTWMLSLRIALDLFDAVEMLEVILDENELSHDIPRAFEKVIIGFVCFSFLLSTLQLLEIKLDYGDWKPRKCTSVSRKTLCLMEGAHPLHPPPSSAPAIGHSGSLPPPLDKAVLYSLSCNLCLLKAITKNGKLNGILSS